MPVAAASPIKLTLPSDVQSLHAMVLERDLLIEKLKLQIARMKRARFGASSEKLDTQIVQLELIVEDLESTLSAHATDATTQTSPSDVAATSKAAAATPATPTAPASRALPEHLPRERLVYEPKHHGLAGADCGCKHCGADGEHLTVLGADESELLEYVPGRFKVLVQVRPKYLCNGCKAISQVDAPSRPLPRSYAGAGLLAHVLTSKYADHLPLYRQSEIYAREGVELSRSTLADWVGGASKLLDPLVQSLANYVKGATKLHADDTPVPVLQPGRGTTKTGRLWTYVRDDRSAPNAPNAPNVPTAPTEGQCPEPAAVWFAYSPDRKGEHPVAHLKDFKGILQADGYAGFERLYQRCDEHGSPEIVEAACWAHVRRKFFDLHALQASPVALEALNRISALYKIESEIRGKPPDERRRRRQLHTEPLMRELKDWFEQTLARVSKKSELAVSIRYALTRWVGLTRFIDDGRVEIDNNAAERALRCVAVGRRNYLFAGSDAGGERAAAIYSLIGTAKLNGIDPEAYLRYVITHISEHRINKVAELLPWNVEAKLPRLAHHTTETSALAA
jgi:transposase